MNIIFISLQLTSYQDRDGASNQHKEYFFPTQESLQFYQAWFLKLTINQAIFSIEFRETSTFRSFLVLQGGPHVRKCNNMTLKYYVFRLYASNFCEFKHVFACI